MAGHIRRWCMICDCQLVTCKNYININSSKALRIGLLATVKEATGDDGLQESQNLYLCNKCLAKLNNVKKFEVVSKEIKDNYVKTKTNHMDMAMALPLTSHMNVNLTDGDGFASRSTTSTSTSTAGRTCSGTLTPDKATWQPSKRRAEFSPGTPRSKPLPKRLHGNKVLLDKENRTACTISSSTRNENASPRLSRLGEDLQTGSEKPRTQKRRTKLSFEPLETACESVGMYPEVEISVHHPHRTEKARVSEKWTGVVQEICKGNDKKAVEHVLKMEAVRTEMKELFLDEIKSEANHLCQPTAKSSFRETSVESLESFSWKKQEQELQEKAPLLHSVVKCVSESEHIDTNTRKTRQTILPKQMTSASILLNCRSQTMNSSQLVNSLLLKESASKKQAFSRLSTRGVCGSYSTTMSLQSALGEDFDAEVKEWGRDIHDGNEKERDMLKNGDLEGLEQHNKQRKDKGFQLVVDNVDIMIQARHPTKDNYGRDYHMVNMMAVENRVTAFHLSTERPDVNLQLVDTSSFLPTVTDNRHLKQEWKILCGRVIKEHMPKLKRELHGLPTQIHHEHMTEAKTKSKVVDLGVVMHDENTSGGIYNIMHHLHEYVPGHGTTRPTTVISAGDLLTCERESSCIEEQRNSKTASQQLQGLMPAIADFHALANFYQVIWKVLYDPASGADKGTIYAARNYLKTNNVTADPMRNVNAAEHLIEQYTIALIIAAALLFFGMEDCQSEPSKHCFSLDVHGDRSTYSDEIMGLFVEEFALPTNESIALDSTEFKCEACNKVYASKKNLLKHTRDKHAGVAPPTDTSGSGPDVDRVQNYSRVALGMGLLALDFRDARKLGDGERIMRLYKFLLLHCKASKKPKYSYHMLRMLAQVQLLLSPRLSHDLVWNRFINTSGRQDGNVEVDRVMEHHNRIFKDHCRGLRGKLTQKNIDRISRSAQKVNHLLDDIDSQVARQRHSSSRHKVDRKDAVTLAVDLHSSDIFGFHPGRAHRRFPQFPSSHFKCLDPASLHEWIRTTLKTLSRQNQFSKKLEISP